LFSPNNLIDTGGSKSFVGPLWTPISNAGDPLDELVRFFQSKAATEDTPVSAETESLSPEQLEVSVVGDSAVLRLMVIMAPGGRVPFGIVTSPTTPWFQIRRQASDGVDFKSHRLDEHWQDYSCS